MIELKNIDVTFKQKERTVHAVKQVNLTIEQGDVYGIVGYSGAGKSTLVRVINLLQRPSAGEVIVEGTNLVTLNPKQLREKRKSIGMIFQHFNLMNSRTVFDNVDFPLKYEGLSKAERVKRVNELLELVGISDKAHAYPSQLSGGQKQRVAIARALASQPSVLLCDEATSALDPKTTLQILALLKDLNRKLGLTIVLITHEMQVVKEICNKVAVMENGEVLEVGDVVTIFSQPKEQLTQDFIRTATHMDQALDTILTHPKVSSPKPGEWLLELSYLGSETEQPLIVELHRLFNVTANILHGNIEIVDGTEIGNLIITLAGEEHKKQEAIAYIESRGVKWRLLKRTLEGSDATC